MSSRSRSSSCVLSRSASESNIDIANDKRVKQNVKQVRHKSLPRSRTRNKKAEKLEENHGGCAGENCPQKPSNSNLKSLAIVEKCTIGSHAQSYDIQTILDFVLATVIDCKAGPGLYRYFRKMPPVSNAVNLAINPRHTKLSWRRVVTSRKYRLQTSSAPGSEDGPETTLPRAVAGVFPDKVLSEDSLVAKNEPQPEPALLTEPETRNIGISIAIQNQSEVPELDMKSASCTDDESVGTVIPNKFKNAREFTRKEEFLQRASSSARTRSRPEQKCSLESPYIEEEMSSTSVTTIGSISWNENETGDELIDGLVLLYNNLKTLWLNVDERARVPYIHDMGSFEEHKINLVNLCSFIVKEMKSEWENSILSAIDKEKFAKLEETNRVLAQQVESARAVQSCLQEEIKFMKKDKGNLSRELKELSMQLAEVQLKEERKATRKSSSSSLGFDISRSASAERLPGNRVEKCAADFNNLVDAVKSRTVDTQFYETQFEKFNQQIKELEQEITEVREEKANFGIRYANLEQDHRALQKETKKYESTLRFVLKDKDSGNGQELIESLLEKVNAIETGSTTNIRNGNVTSKFVIMEGALQSAEDQNRTLREEISQLKSALAGLNEKKDGEYSELEQKCAESQRNVQKLTKRLNDKINEMNRAEEMSSQKESQWNDHCKSLGKEKERLESLVEEKEFELKKQMDVLHGYEKRNLRQEKRVQDMHKSNGRLKREIQDLKQNMEALNNIVHQLRSSLREQKIQWTERFKAQASDADQAKHHCKWLQTQVEHLNSQVVQSQDRIKEHEKDKCSLALQILAIDEERKLVDEKLRELNAALQGDSSLRENLMERNDALQRELHRMRQGRIASLGRSVDGWDDNGNFGSLPPSEMSNLEPILPPHVANMVNATCDKVRKNCYTTASTSNRRTIEVPRSAVSLDSHNLNSSFK